jgi:hypothetical protein
MQRSSSSSNGIGSRKPMALVRANKLGSRRPVQSASTVGFYCCVEARTMIPTGRTVLIDETHFRPLDELQSMVILPTAELNTGVQL